MTLVCVPILVQDVASALADAHAAKEGGADLVEFRVDEFFSGSGEKSEAEGVAAMVSGSPIPCILTCRMSAEGGHYDGPEDARVALFERVAAAFGRGEHPPRYIDVELAAYERSANARQKIRLAIDHPEQVRDLATSMIVSMHDFKDRPADLHRRVSRMAAEPAARVLKVAYRARSLRDCLELLDLASHTGKPTIALGIGEFGLASRVLAPKFGGFLTFASLNPESVTAPGQPTLAELLDLYRFRSINADTAVYGVIGWPVRRSRSPRLHNAGFAAVGENAVYLPLPVAADADPESSYASFKATLLDLIEHPRFGLRGASVTMPHKEHLVRLARERGWLLDACASTAGAANTLAVTSEGIRATNTDAGAVLDAVREAVGDVTGRRVLILGTGGMAKAVSYNLRDAGCRVSCWARSGTPPHGCDPAPWGTLPPGVDVLINATPVGMAGGDSPNDSPVPAEALARLGPKSVVCDCVYVPRWTPLLRAAHARGLATIDGVSIFVRQAREQFRAWTGNLPPGGLYEGLMADTL